MQDLQRHRLFTWYQPPYTGSNVNAVLTDVSITDVAPSLRHLAWVGMAGIDVLVVVHEDVHRREVHARADVQVDLPGAHVKGIHMSRLHRLLDTLGDGGALNARFLHRLLRALVDSHRDCCTGNARIRFGFDLSMRRPALATEVLSDRQRVALDPGKVAPGCSATPPWRHRMASVAMHTSRSRSPRTPIRWVCPR